MKMRRYLAALLALVMLLGLAACGGSGDEKQKSPEATPAPEFVYQAQYKTLVEDGESGLYSELYTDDGLYAERYEKVGEKPIPEGVVPEYEGEYDINKQMLYFVSYDGEIRKLEKYSPLAGAENTEGYADFNSDSSLYSLSVDDDGTLTTIEQVYSSWYDGPEDLTRDDDEYWEHYQNTQSYYMRKLDADGAELSCVEMDLGDTDGMYGSDSTVTDENGNMLMSYYTDNGSAIMAISPEGQVAYNIELETYGEGFVKLKDGRAAVTSWGNEGRVLRVIDPAKGELGESIKIPNDAYNLVPGDDRYDFYYTSGVNLMGYSVDEGEPVKLINWIDCDVNSDDMNNFHIMADGSIVAVLNEWGGEDEDRKVTTELMTISLVPSETVPVKEHLTLAVDGLGYDLRNMIIDFNRGSDKYRIDVKDYSEYDTDDDYSAGITKLTTEILAGNVPDLICLDQLPYTQLAVKGLLEDLYPYLDADGELSRDDFFPSVLRAMEVDGGLYQVCADFNIITVAGPRSVIGDKTGWTYDEVYQALEQMPEGCEIFSADTTKEQVFQMCMYISMDSFVDWTTGKCSFDSEDFIKLLEFTDKFPLDYDFENYDSTVDSDRVRISEGRQLLMTTGFYSFDEIQYNDFYFGGKDSAVYVGYPTADGSTGSAMYMQGGVGMSAKCADKDAAWQFLRTFLTEEYQEDFGYRYNLCTNKNSFMKGLKEASTPEYRKDSQGNFILDENGEKIEISHGGVTFGDGTSYDIYALTQEQADQLMDIVENTARTVQFNQSLYDLIDKEVQAYFNGQKSAQETAKLIQSKVNIYVNEQK